MVDALYRFITSIKVAPFLGVTITRVLYYSRIRFTTSLGMAGKPSVSPRRIHCVKVKNEFEVIVFKVINIPFTSLNLMKI